MGLRREALIQMGNQNIISGLSGLEKNKRQQALDDQRLAGLEREEEKQELVRMRQNRLDNAARNKEATSFLRDIEKTEGREFTKEQKAGISESFRAGDTQTIADITSSAPVSENFINKREREIRKEELENRKLLADILKVEGKGPSKDKDLIKDLNKATSEIRKEVSTGSTSRDFQKVAASFGKIKQTFDRPKSAAGDLGMIFNIMKVFDPGSVVRESEFKTAAAAAGVPARIINTFDRLRMGTRLTKEQRKDFMEVARIQARAQLDAFKRAINPQIEAAKARGLPASQIFPAIDPSLGNLFQQRQLQPENINNSQAQPNTVLTDQGDPKAFRINQGAQPQQNILIREDGTGAASGLTPEQRIQRIFELTGNDMR